MKLFIKIVLGASFQYMNYVKHLLPFLNFIVSYTNLLINQRITNLLKCILKFAFDEIIKRNLIKSGSER